MFAGDRPPRYGKFPVGVVCNRALKSPIGAVSNRASGGCGQAGVLAPVFGYLKKDFQDSQDFQDYRFPVEGNSLPQ